MLSTLSFGLVLIYLYNLSKNIYFARRMRKITNTYLAFISDKSESNRPVFSEQLIEEATELLKRADMYKELVYGGLRLSLHSDYANPNYRKIFYNCFRFTEARFAYKIKCLINPILLISSLTENTTANGAFNRFVKFLSSGIVTFLLGLYAEEIKTLLDELILLAKNAF